ncbi:MAG: circularly permuted type 2 ATP-grasp protein [Actinomycetota bacterium]|nr:circularly permuted type 2 ATP-grasp protein [Actinomycetota bacterium]
MPRPVCASLHETLQSLADDDFERRCEARDRAFRDQGITFSFSGEERPFPLDLVPRILGAEEWALLESGVVQRVRALEAFLDDIYGVGRILSDRVVPAALVTSSQHYHRAANGVEPPNGVRIHVAGIDVVRGGDGRFCVLEDNLRTPSGISYVVENRRTMSRVFPELFASHRVRPVDSYPARLLEGLKSAAPTGAADPTVVVLTPGVYNAAYFEHSFLARQMGVELVEGRDLVCRNNCVYMRATTGEQRVDVVYRRIDDDYLDPLHFRTDSRLGCPGILNAARAGNVTIANAVGNGVADDKLVYTYVPAIIDYYLGEKPILPNVTTYRLEDPDQLALALDRLDRLVIKPVDASGGRGLLIGSAASDEELAHAATALTANPRGWIAQETVDLSTAPTRVGGRLRPRHLDLRPFAVNDGDRVWVVPGGLTRVALPEGSLVVNSSQGGGSKDTWVLAGDGPRPVPTAAPDRGPGTPGAGSTETGRAETGTTAPEGTAAPEGTGPEGTAPESTGTEVTEVRTGPRPDPGPAVAQAAQQQQDGPPC